MTKEYKAKTKDDEVYTLAEVQVDAMEEKTELEVVSLADYNTRIDHAQGQIAYWQAELTKLQAEYTLIEVEAKKVILKKEMEEII